MEHDGGYGETSLPCCFSRMLTAGVLQGGLPKSLLLALSRSRLSQPCPPTQLDLMLDFSCRFLWLEHDANRQHIVELILQTESKLLFFIGCTQTVLQKQYHRHFCVGFNFL